MDHYSEVSSQHCNLVLPTVYEPVKKFTGELLLKDSTLGSSVRAGPDLSLDYASKPFT